MSDSPVTFHQLRVCIIAASERLTGAETGTTETDRLEQLCNQYDADYHPAMHDLVGQLENFGAYIRGDSKDVPVFKSSLK